MRFSRKSHILVNIPQKMCDFHNNSLMMKPKVGAKFKSAPSKLFFDWVATKFHLQDLLSVSHQGAALSPNGGGS